MPTRLLNRNYLLLIAVTFCSGLTAQLLNTTMPLFLVNALGSSTSISGLLSGLYTIIACIARPIAGIWVDRIGRRPFIIAGMILFGLSCILFGFTASVALLILFRLLQGIGFGISSTASSTAASDNIPPARLGEGLGYIGMSNSLPMLVGPSLALLLIGTDSYTIPFVCAGILCFAGAVLAILTRENESIIREVKSSAKKQKLTLSSLYERSAVPPALITLFLALAGACVMVYGSLFAQYKGYDNINAFFIVSALGMILIRILTSKVVDNFNAYLITIPSCILWAASFILMLLVDTPAMFLVAGAVYGICLGLSQTVLNTVALRGVPADRRGAASATFMFCFDDGIGFGALFWGVLIDLVGGNYDVMIIAGVVMLLLAALFSLIFMLRGGGNPETTAPAG